MLSSPPTDTGPRFCTCVPENAQTYAEADTTFICDPRSEALRLAYRPLLAELGRGVPSIMPTVIVTRPSIENPMRGIALRGPCAISLPSRMRSATCSLAGGRPHRSVAADRGERSNPRGSDVFYLSRALSELPHGRTHYLDWLVRHALRLFGAARMSVLTLLLAASL